MLFQLSYARAHVRMFFNGPCVFLDYFYLEPSNFAGRNGRLLADVDSTLSSLAKSEFIELSSSFRSGVLAAPDYFRKASGLINTAGGHAATIRYAELNLNLIWT